MSKVISVEPDMSVGQAVRKAGFTGESFFSAPRNARRSDVRPQGRSFTEGCPGCAVGSIEMLRRIIRFGGSSICRNCRREARR
ncbi:MAG: hypothetical protein OXK17_08485 [Thaumarchaeota archaeon]|nr:hypothetical protein [Nitrososphaerota archaeon]